MTLRLTLLVALAAVAAHVARAGEEDLVPLMGVSSAVYVGNEVVQKGEQEKRWEDVEQKVNATVEQLERAKEPERAKLVKELGGMLRGLY